MRILGSHSDGFAYEAHDRAMASAEPLAVEMKTIAGDGAADDQFGRSVAIDGDLMVVGSWGDDEMGDHSGSAYVYHFDGSDWVEEAKLTAADGEAGDSFGISVAVSGETVVVGSWGNDEKGEAAGSAYVFARNHGGDGQWGQVEKLVDYAVETGGAAANVPGQAQQRSFRELCQQLIA